MTAMPDMGPESCRAVETEDMGWEKEKEKERG